MSKLIIDGNAVYEIDEECMKKKGERKTAAEKKGNRIQEGKTAGPKNGK